MRELESHSIDELEELTGFDRRTISYYISEGLLPKVGRRGRNTRYGKVFADRLKFIQRVKDLQDAGKLPSVTLEDLAALINRMASEEVIEAARSNKNLLELFADKFEAGDGELGLDEIQPDACVDSELNLLADEAEGGEGFAKPESRIAPASRRRDFYTAQSVQAPAAAYLSETEDLRELQEDTMRAMREMRDATLHAMHEMRDMHEASNHKMLEMNREMFEDSSSKMLEMNRAKEREMMRLRDEVRELREELTELRRGMPTAGAIRRLNRQGEAWAEARGLVEGMVRVARLRPDGCSWDFPVDPKMLMLRDAELLVACEGRPGIDADVFIPLRISLEELAAIVKPFEKLRKSARVRRCVVLDEGARDRSYGKEPAIELSEYRIDEPHRRYAKKGA